MMGSHSTRNPVSPRRIRLLAWPRSPSQQGVDQLGQHGVLVAVHSGEELLAAGERPEEVLPDFVPHRASPER